jgi:ATP-binding cassette subfamily A (ABC1) protein 3
MRISAYWVSNYIYDFILYMVVAIIAVSICKGFEITSLTKGDAFFATCMLFLFYGLSYISLTYIFAFLFKDYGSAQAGFYFLTFIAGGIAPILTILLRFLGKQSNLVGRGLAWVLRLYPAYAFG